MDMDLSQTVIVTFYKPYGKYYDSCEITVTNRDIISGEMPLIVIERQNAIKHESVGNYNVVVRSRDGFDSKEHAFCDRLILADRMKACADTMYK